MGRDYPYKLLNADLELIFMQYQLNEMDCECTFWIKVSNTIGNNAFVIIFYSLKMLMP